MDNVIKVSDKVTDLTGEGLEYLVVAGEVIAKFFNGNMVGDSIGNSEITKKAA